MKLNDNLLVMTLSSSLVRGIIKRMKARATPEPSKPRLMTRLLCINKSLPALYLTLFHSISCFKWTLYCTRKCAYPEQYLTIAIELSYQNLENFS